MTLSTPHPPETLLVASSENPNTPCLFQLKPDVRVIDALTLASDYLASTAAIVYEAAENTTPEYRPLTRAAVHQLEAVRMLVDASVAGLEANEGR